MLLTNCVRSFLLVSFVSCALFTTAQAQDRQPFESVLIKDIPHVRQRSDFCGEACVAMYLKKLGHDVDQDFVFDNAGLDPKLARGCFTKELASSIKRIGFDTGNNWYRVDAKKSSSQLQQMFAVLHADLKSGNPAILCTRFDKSPNTTEHFRLFIGYDAEKDELIYHDPALDSGDSLRMKRADLIDLWPLKYDEQKWTVIYLPLRNRELNVKALKDAAEKTRYTNADFAQHYMKLKKKIPGPEFHTVIQNPFVVIGDESPEMVQRRATGTVKWAVDRIKKVYFDKDPDAIIDIWLFKNKESYEKHCKQLFGSKPSTPYGYYSHSRRVLVMNIATGGGTLVHEIVHPFMASNFEACPSWFNEGLASLYEQSADANGAIMGLTNWRLRGLQLAIEDDRVPSFKTLCATTTNEFYDEDPGTNYSQARYLCYYLQQNGLLTKYYHAFHKNAESDPGGYETLKQILKRDDMVAFKKEWEKYVLDLRFGR